MTDYLAFFGFNVDASGGDDVIKFMGGGDGVVVGCSATHLHPCNGSV